MPPVLKALSLSKSFGGLKAFVDVTLQVDAREIVAVIGPNGAGKTTLFNTLSGIYKPNDGTIYFLEENITGLAPHQICRKGIARTFQNIRLFQEMTVLENVLVGQMAHQQVGWKDILLRTPSFRTEEKKVVRQAFELLDQVGLRTLANELACNLSYGYQRRLEIARALATQPKLLMLDEPGAGMNETELHELIDIIARLKDQGLAILLIEHHMKVVMQISDHIIVLNHGEELAVGTPSEIAENPQVISAYLGETLHH